MNDDIEREQSMSNNPTVRIPGQGRTIAVVGDVYRFLATALQRTDDEAVREASTQIAVPKDTDFQEVQQGRAYQHKCEDAEN